MLVFTVLVILASFTDGAHAVKSPERPIAPNVTVTNSTEMKITWCRVNSNNVEINRYELFIDGALEYSGLDISYVAKRLKPWMWYEVKLRACGFFLGSCSPYSMPVMTKTLRHSEKATAAVIQKGVTLVKVVALPTYAFVLGVMVGVVLLSLGMLWRYFHTTEWMTSPPFELQLLIKASEAELGGVSQEKNNLKITNGSTTYSTTGSNSSAAFPSTKAYQAESCMLMNAALGIDPSLLEYENTSRVCNPTLKAVEMGQATLYRSKVCPSLKTALQQQIAACFPAANRGKFVQHNGDCIWSPDGYQKVEKLERGDMHPLFHLPKVHNTYAQRIRSTLQQSPLYEDKQTETENLSLTATAKSEHASEEKHYEYSNNITSELAESHCSYTEISNDSETTATDAQTVTVECSKHDPVNYTKTEVLKEVSLSTTAADTERDGIVVAIDNSNIYIGAQESASALNHGERKRNVRLKIQNLVRILEQNRPKAQGFACGSSPPATEQVWEVYRRLGYTVDLEDRRGKDEQRVDEGLHLCIYKALCELSPRVLVLATGDGMKGKSEQGTSFPGCAASALERGWRVEVHSWKHSLSAEWHKLAKKYPERLKIFCLDKYVNHVTFVDGKNGRKSLHVPTDFTM